MTHDERSEATGLPAPVLALLLAGLTIWFGFEAGGYYADVTGWAAAGLLVVLAGVALVWGRPPGGLTPPLAIGAAALALFGAWTLASGAWSDDPARALIEFDRVLLYLAALLLFASAASSRETLAATLPAFGFAAVVLCGSGVFVRTLPESWPFSLPDATERMDFPLSYPNALGALAALGLVACLALAASPERRVALRAASAAALPLLAAALILTFSRGATLAVVVGVVGYAALARSRGLLTVLLAAGPAVALAAFATLDADLIAGASPRTPRALDEGEDLAPLLAATCVLAGSLLVFLRPLERRVARLAVPRVRPAVGAAAVAALLAAAIGVAAATGAAESLYDRVLDQQQGESAPTRARLVDVSEPGSESRARYWRVSLDAFQAEPIRGEGAGTFGRLWVRNRTVLEPGDEGHSVYLEPLGELGIVGGLLMLVILGSLIYGLTGGTRGSRSLRAGLLAAALTWGVHAGLDWDWENPALTFWLFAAGGCALAATGRPLGRPGRPAHWGARVAMAVVCVLLAIPAATVAISQGQLDSADEALRDGDCARSEESARDAISTFSARPEPWELLAYCQARTGRAATAVRTMGEAIERDPHNWRLHYGLALVRGAAGQDPRPAARAALRLNPLESITRDGVERFSSARRRVWIREAREARLPLPAESRARP